MATQNDYGLTWLTPSAMLGGDATMGMQSQDLMSMEPRLENPYYSPMPSYENAPQQPMEIDGFLMMDDYDHNFCEEPPHFMAPATRTVPGLRKKISPVKHPGLKLQTPIAFKCDSDPSVIPIMKDGMAKCEACGAIGVKHAFYTRNRNYCSLACSRAYLMDNQNQEDSQGAQEPTTTFKLPYGGEVDDKELVTKVITELETEEPLPGFNLGPHIASFPFTNLELPDYRIATSTPSSRVRSELALSYDWLPLLENPEFIAMPVNCFARAPMSDCWDDVTEGMKVEVENCLGEAVGRMPAACDSFWLATVLRIAGYKAQLRYEGAGEGQDFWVNLCSPTVHPVGWCAMRGKPLIPPAIVAQENIDWKNFLVRRLTGARTLPSNFQFKVSESMKPRFRIGLNLEVVDMQRICQTRVATVRKITGKRMMLTLPYEDQKTGYWVHEDSSLIHPAGWSIRVGHKMSAPPAYRDRCESGLLDKDDAAEELFTAPYQSVSDWSCSMPFPLREGMFIEAVDPLNLSAISAATIVKVLRDGFIMVRIVSFLEDRNDDKNDFCYHASSPCILPPGFCRDHDIPLRPPADADLPFSWEQYAAKTKARLAPASFFNTEVPDHGIEVGMQLECVDLMEPHMVCVAKVRQVVGRLLKINFDGWGDEYDQWMDYRSSDFYPVGWCQLVGHMLQPPNRSEGTEVLEKKKPPVKVRKMKRKGKRGMSRKCQEDKNINEIDEESKDGILAPAHNISPSNTSDVLATASEPTVPSGNEPPAEASTASPAPDSLSTPSNEPYIPRLSDTACDAQLDPSSWSPKDVATFLNLNDCSCYSDVFLSKEINGSKFLAMTQDELVVLTGKIGPALKIFSQIQQLILKTKTTKASRKFNL